MDNSFGAFRANLYLSGIAATMEAGGPVRVKSTQAKEAEDQAMYVQEERRLANQARLAREAEAQRQSDALTTPAERARIERDKQRRTDRKADKKAAKKATALRR